MKALQFYEDCVDHITHCEISNKEFEFDLDVCRAYCFVGKSYSHSKFMHYVAEFFGTTIGEMKSIENKLENMENNMVELQQDDVKLMPCGSNHSCYHCNGYYFGCTWLERMTEEKCDKHEQLVIITK